MKSQGDRMLEALFEGRPKSLRLFHAIRMLIENLGHVKMEITKTQVSFGAERKFAWVWLPQMWVKAPKNSITLAFGLERKINSPKIRKATEPYPGRWIHHIIIEEEKDIDEDVHEFLREAYAFGVERAKPRRRLPSSARATN